jgi:hypothetical protein
LLEDVHIAEWLSEITGGTVLKTDTFTFSQLEEFIRADVVVGADAKVLAEDVGLSGCYALMGTKVIFSEDGT